MILQGAMIIQAGDNPHVTIERITAFIPRHSAPSSRRSHDPRGLTHELAMAKENAQGQVKKHRGHGGVLLRA